MTQSGAHAQHVCEYGWGVGVSPGEWRDCTDVVGLFRKLGLTGIACRPVERFDHHPYRFDRFEFAIEFWSMPHLSDTHDHRSVLLIH
jgi:hypothetical protein